MRIRSHRALWLGLLLGLALPGPGRAEQDDALQAEFAGAINISSKQRLKDIYARGVDKNGTLLVNARNRPVAREREGVVRIPLMSWVVRNALEDRSLDVKHGLLLLLRHQPDLLVEDENGYGLVRIAAGSNPSGTCHQGVVTALLLNLADPRLADGPDGQPSVQASLDYVNRELANHELERCRESAVVLQRALNSLGGEGVHPRVEDFVRVVKWTATEDANAVPDLASEDRERLADQIALERFQGRQAELATSGFMPAADRLQQEIDQLQAALATGAAPASP